jgi:hypothetical protein
MIYGVKLSPMFSKSYDNPLQRLAGSSSIFVGRDVFKCVRRADASKARANTFAWHAIVDDELSKMICCNEGCRSDALCCIAGIERSFVVRIDEIEALELKFPSHHPCHLKRKTFKFS